MKVLDDFLSEWFILFLLREGLCECPTYIERVIKKFDIQFPKFI